MSKIRLTESQLHKVIKESVRKIMTEMSSNNVVEKVQQMIDKFNDEYNSVVQEYGESSRESCLNKDGNWYGFSKPIYIKGNGYIVFPFMKDAYGIYKPMQIRTFTKAGGKIRYYKDESYYDEDYRDALKLIKTSIEDLERGKKHLEGYDPNWEDNDNPNGEKNIKSFNKSIGIKN